MRREADRPEVNPQPADSDLARAARLAEASRWFTERDDGESSVFERFQCWSDERVDEEGAVAEYFECWIDEHVDNRKTWLETMEWLDALRECNERSTRPATPRCFRFHLTPHLCGRDIGKFIPPRAYIEFLIAVDRLHGGLALRAVSRNLIRRQRHRRHNQNSSISFHLILRSKQRSAGYRQTAGEVSSHCSQLNSLAGDVVASPVVPPHALRRYSRAQWSAQRTCNAETG
jgi:hypothetical protein